MFELLFAMAFWPWIVTIIALGFLFASAYSEITFLGVFGLFVFIAGSWFLFHTNVFAWAGDHPLPSVALFATYVLAGMGWSLFKWRRRLLSPQVQLDMQNAKDEYEKRGDEMREQSYRQTIYFPSAAKPAENVDRIISWIMWWPMSAVVFIFNDLLHDFFHWVYELMSGLYEGLTKRYMP